LPRGQRGPAVLVAKITNAAPRGAAHRRRRCGSAAGDWRSRQQHLLAARPFHSEGSTASVPGQGSPPRAAAEIYDHGNDLGWRRIESKPLGWLLQAAGGGGRGSPRHRQSRARGRNRCRRGPGSRCPENSPLRWRKHGGAGQCGLDSRRTTGNGSVAAPTSSPMTSSGFGAGAAAAPRAADAPAAGLIRAPERWKRCRGLDAIWSLGSGREVTKALGGQAGALPAATRPAGRGTEGLAW